MSHDHQPTVEQLEAHHTFPGTFRIKVIGDAADDFEGRVLAVVREEVPAPGAIEHSTRSTSGGRHVSLTLDIHVQDAKQVLALYGRFREIEGVKVLL